MRTMPVWLVFVCRVIIIVLVPLVLTLTNVRLLLTHAFPIIEYNIIGVTPDAYGLSTADRIKWSNLSMDYLMGSQGMILCAPFVFRPV